ncbi:glycerol-3-phosphate acyltransferase 1, mitochondrial-like isoform X2 [Actinia tenebrosa]|uniref:Glycerol-3-phosphate acyltransferase 1, mitochondrial-like isoform X2 n=1 Tax=Actinia tenebrosa TaxID=6105 RepID=A0A6P8HZW0_ACTTE|nr:glycerol-3-phosphate acyltransferase 1, mitochondrial-like isoform X2 [Actinia tenebrosa]
MDSEQMKKIEEVYKKWEKKSSGGRYAAGSVASTGMQTGRSEGGNDWVRKYGYYPQAPTRRPARSKRRKQKQDDFEPMLPVERKFQVPPAIIPGEFSRERPFMGKGCKTCCSDSVQLLYHDRIPSRGMHNILNIAVYHKQNLFRRTFCHMTFIWNCDVSYDFPDVKKSVVNSERVQNCIMNSVFQESANGNNAAQLTEKELKSLDKARQQQITSLTKKANEIINRMAAGIYRKLIRFTGWFLFKLFGRLLTSIQIHRGQIEMVQQATQENKPLVFLPLHKSHLDYILVTYVLLTCDIKSPHVAAGDNLGNMFLFSWLMRHLGGFFIKRKLDHTSGKDDLYKCTLQEYIQQLLIKEQYLEMFIEGSRSRTGKAMVPKSGLLSIVVNAVLEGIVPDVLIVPVNISYEKTFETSYSRELLGEPKRPETFYEAVKGIFQVLGSRYGHIRVDFSQPFSLKEFSENMDLSVSMQEFGSTMVARSSVTSSPASSMLRNVSDLSLSDFGEDKCFSLTKVLGYHVIYDAVQCSAVMSTNMLAFLFIYNHRKGASFDELVYSFDELRQEILSRGRDVGFSGKTPDVVQHALELLGNLVDVEENGEEKYIKPRLRVPEVIDLHNYSNLVLCIFALEAVVACSICAVAQENDIEITDIEQEQSLPQTMIIEKAEDLCELLQKEFIFIPPCASLEARLKETIDKFISSEILQSTTQTSSSSRQWSTWDDEEDSYSAPEPEYKLTTSMQELSRLKFLQSLLSPLIESYWVAACGLLWLPGQAFTEDEFLRAVHDCSKERLQQDVTMYPESCSLEPYRNAIRIFKENMVLELFKESDGTKTLLRLTDRYNNQESIFEFISSIGQFKM